MQLESTWSGWTAHFVSGYDAVMLHCFELRPLWKQNQMVIRLPDINIRHCRGMYARWSIDWHGDYAIGGMSMEFARCFALVIRTLSLI